MQDTSRPLVWRAAIKKATMTQKFDQRGEVHSTLQLVCEGDMLPPELTKELALLQQEAVVVLTIQAAQLTFAWSAPNGGTVDAEISEEGPRSGRDPAEEPAGNPLTII